jgi:glycosyltransferase involved in cell wall biosynthesis
VSEDIKRQIVFLPFVKNKIAVIKNGIEPVTLISKEIAQETLKNLNPHLNRIDTNGKIWIGTISELHTTKGLIYAIGAIKRVVEHHPNIVFLIIGEGELRHKLEALIHTAGLDETVFLLGYVDNAPTLLSAFDIFTLSSISEALSYTILEAGHAGLPIVASRVGGIPEIITHQEVGMLVEAKNSDAITQALEELIEKPQQRERMGSLLKKRVDGTFTKEQMLKKTMELYQT